MPPNFPVMGTAFDPDDSLLDTAASAEPLDDAPHLTLGGLLGRGSMGEVYEAHDRRLGRQVALKLLGERWASNEGARSRFLIEARATAQLAHPAIVGVHEVGIWEDGRPFYTMDILSGETLEKQIQRFHRRGYTLDGLHRLLDRLRRACEAVGYAHTRGVIHRDLKPANLLIGEFGEISVADWGLVQADPDTDHALQAGTASGTSTLSGTPRYMSPEQVASGELGPPSDVFSLGCILAWITTGELAFPQTSVRAVFQAVCTPRGLTQSGPESLRPIVDRALALDPDDRFPDANALADALGSYLDGAARRARALHEVETAKALEPTIQRLLEEADHEDTQAKQALKDLAPWAPVEEKQPGWAHEDAANRLRAEASTLATERLDRAEAALSHDPELPEALELLADHYRNQLSQAEATRNHTDAQVAERRLRRFDRGRYAGILEGQGSVTLVTEPAGATVYLHAVSSTGRLRQVGQGSLLGQTPLLDCPVPHGDHELHVHLDGHHEVVMPITVGRDEHLDGIRPGDDEPTPIPLLPNGSLGPNDIYVPAGWTWAGANDLDFTTDPGQRVWVDGFVIQRFPVTNREFIAFLERTRLWRGDEEALNWVPRERAARAGERGPMCYGRDANGAFVLQPDADGDVWDMDWPVLLVDWYSAVAFADERASQTSQAWRLPTTQEWEKAGRGSDGRLFPWGDSVDPAYACTRESHPGRPLPARVDTFPVDVSPYGVRGMAGNVRDWCSDVTGAQDEQRAIRGGCFFFPAKASMLPIPYALEPHRNGDTIGFRVAYSV